MRRVGRWGGGYQLGCDVAEFCVQLGRGVQVLGGTRGLGEGYGEGWGLENVHIARGGVEEGSCACDVRVRRRAVTLSPVQAARSGLVQQLASPNSSLVQVSQVVFEVLDPHTALRFCTVVGALTAFSGNRSRL